MAETLLDSVATILPWEGRVGLGGLPVGPQSFTEEIWGKEFPQAAHSSALARHPVCRHCRKAFSSVATSADLHQS